MDKPQRASLVKSLLLSLCIGCSASLHAKPLTFEASWQQLLKNSPKLMAEQQQVKRAQASKDASESLSYPSLDIGGSYTRLEKPLELDLRDLNPLASIDPNALPPALGNAISAIPRSLFVTPFTDTLKDDYDALLPSLYAVIVTELLKAPANQVLDVSGHIQRHVLAPRAKDQRRMNAYFTGTPYSLAERYTVRTVLER